MLLWWQWLAETARALDRFSFSPPQPLHGFVHIVSTLLWDTMASAGKKQRYQVCLGVTVKMITCLEGLLILFVQNCTKRILIIVLLNRKHSVQQTWKMLEFGGVRVWKSSCAVWASNDIFAPFRILLKCFIFSSYILVKKIANFTFVFRLTFLDTLCCGKMLYN